MRPGTQEPRELDKAGRTPHPEPVHTWISGSGSPWEVSECLWSFAYVPRTLGVPSGASGLVGRLYFSRRRKHNPKHTPQNTRELPGAPLAACLHGAAVTPPVAPGGVSAPPAPW